MLEFLKMHSGREVITPPPALQEELDGPAYLGASRARPAPPTYSYTQRREPVPNSGSDTFVGVPASNQNPARWTQNIPAMLGISSWQDAPDPVRQSDFVAAGDKIHPFAGDITPMHTCLWKNNNIAGNFQVGKLIAPHLNPMYAGRQNPLIDRTNITEGQQTTFGSKFTLNGVPGQGNVSLPSGLVSNFNDGYPY